MNLCNWKSFFLPSQYILLQSATYKLQVCLCFSHASSKETIPQYWPAQINGPPESPWKTDQKQLSVSIPHQRSMQCHLQCTSMFGNVVSNLFQPMKWSSWLASFVGIEWGIKRGCFSDLREPSMQMLWSSRVLSLFYLKIHFLLLV